MLWGPSRCLHSSRMFRTRKMSWLGFCLSLIGSSLMRQSCEYNSNISTNHLEAHLCLLNHPIRLGGKEGAFTYTQSVPKIRPIVSYKLYTTSPFHQTCSCIMTQIEIQSFSSSYTWTYLFLISQLLLLFALFLSSVKETRYLAKYKISQQCRYLEEQVRCVNYR